MPFSEKKKSKQILTNFFFPLDSLKSTPLLARLNISRNVLTEFDSEIISSCKQLIALDLSHNQITTLKINEVCVLSLCIPLRTFIFIIIDSKMFMIFLFIAVIECVANY